MQFKERKGKTTKTHQIWKENYNLGIQCCRLSARARRTAKSLPNLSNRIELIRNQYRLRLADTTAREGTQSDGRLPKELPR